MTTITKDEQAAAHLLVHYFTIAAGRNLDPDCRVEIESIIRSTVEAAVQQTRAELQPQIDRLSTDVRLLTIMAKTLIGPPKRTIKRRRAAR